MAVARAPLLSTSRLPMPSEAGGYEGPDIFKTVVRGMEESASD